MLTPAEAEEIILGKVLPLPAEACPLSDASGRILREALVAERDSPPFDRVTMDGYAFSSGVFLNPNVEQSFRVLGFQPAGVSPQTLVTESDVCLEIATGAVLPIGSDCIVPYEDTSRDGDRVSLAPKTIVTPRQNIHPRGSDFRAGAKLVLPGARLTAREIAVAASCGYRALQVSQAPRIAIVATGDELIDVDVLSPAPHQIRRSNDYALRAGLISAGFPKVDCVHLRDERRSMVETLESLLGQFDAVIFTGGVSKGKLDLLPEVLTKLGVKKEFQGIAQRPGKPFWFGLTPNGSPVFALPGNPVSTYVCFHRYVLPALGKMVGDVPSMPENAVLAEAVTFKPPVAYLVPARVYTAPQGTRVAQAVPFNTSGDFSSLVGTHGFIELPAESTVFPADTVVKFWAWR